MSAATCERVVWYDDGGPLVSEPCALEAGHAGPCRDSSWGIAYVRPHATRLLTAPIADLRRDGSSRAALYLARWCAWQPRWRGEDHAALVLVLPEEDPRRVAYERVLAAVQVA